MTRARGELPDEEGQYYTSHSKRYGLCGTVSDGSELSGLEQSAILGRWRPGTVVVALTGFFHESGEHAPDGKLSRLTLGGYFATWDNVKVLCERWREALADENLAEFHMKHIASDEHDYANWSPERQRGLDRFAAILAECASEFRAFTYNVGPSDKTFRAAYITALSRLLMDACTLAKESGERVRLVFAQTPEVSQGHIGRFFDHHNWENDLSGYMVARSRDEPALQAAELAARGMKRLMEDGSVTASFGRLVLTGKPFRFWPENPVAASRLVQAERYAGG